MHVLTRPEAGFYGTHSVATDPGDHWSRLSALAGGPAELAAAVRNLAVHREACGRFGFELPEERRNEAETRYAADIIGVLDGLAGEPLGLAEEREPVRRFAGTCRDFSLLFAAALRHNGVPARLRCGYATYLQEDFHADHWVTEYWKPGRGWTLADAEFAGRDDMPGIDFDTMNVPRDRFIVAGEAWAMCRSGNADPATFGVRLPVLELTGLDMVRANVVRDLAALNKIEVLPWDVWGLAESLSEPGRDADVDDLALALIDQIAELTAEARDFEALREAYEENPRLKITAPVTSYTTYGGVRVVEVRTG